MTIWEQCNAMWDMPIDAVYAIEKKYYNYSNTDECELWQTAKKVVERHERRLAREAEKERQWEIDMSAYKTVYKWPEKWLENDRVEKNGGCYTLDGLTFYVEKQAHITEITESIRKADTMLKMMLLTED
jgi:hypothetical protein